MSDQQSEVPADPGVTRWRYRVREADAIQWTGENHSAIRAFAGPGHTRVRTDGMLGVLTCGGWKDLSAGDWVGREDGELFCSAEKSFARNWEPAAGPLVLPPDEFAVFKAVAARFGYLPAAAVDRDTPPPPLSSAQCGRLREMVTEYGDALSAVRRALDLAGRPGLRSPEDADVIKAAREALKVLEGNEGDDHG